MKPFLSAAALTVSLAGPALADPLQDQVLAAMRRVDTADVAFTSTTAIERTGAKAQEIVTRYDPRAAAGKRWTVVRIDGRAPTAKEATQVLKAANGSPIPTYARLARWFGGAATRVAQTPGSVTYRFARLPAGVLKIGKHDASADTVADAVVNTAGRAPFVERVRLTSSSAFRMMLVAKVERYAFTSSYAPLPDGRPFPSGSDGDMAGSLMGKAGVLKTRTRFGDARATR